MNRLRQVAAVGTMFGVLAGVGPSEATNPVTDRAIAFSNIANTLTPEQTEVLDQARQELFAHWGSLATTKFVVLQGDEKFTCHPPKGAGENYEPNTVGSMSREGPFYCPGDDAVVIEAGWINGFGGAVAGGYPGRAQAIEEFTVDHEYGHRRQHEAGISMLPPEGLEFDDLAAYTQQIELQADCFAGQEMAVTSPELIRPTKEILELFPSEMIDPMHGGADQRLAHFEMGANGSSCL